jgi:calcium-dependent protein kinase
MGNIFKSKVTPKPGEQPPKDGEQKADDNQNPSNPPPIPPKHDDKKDVNMGEIFDEIMDVKGAEKGAMLLSESIGKPNEQYDILKNISPDSYGRVKKVRHKISKNIRSMRIIKKEQVKEEITLLFKELALLRSLDHPNISKLYEFFRDEKYYYLIFDYCEEGELLNLLKKRGRGYPEASVAYIMKQLLSVVAYCHSGNILNRDLRLENILVESIEWKEIHGDEVPLLNIRVSDFKSARSYKNSKKLNKKVGNPYYVAPEVLKRKYNEKCDIWSCGIIAYILLCGKPPFSGTTDREVLDKVEFGTLEYFGNEILFLI